MPVPELLESLANETRLKRQPGGAGRCFHCGEPCADRSFARNDKLFCCQGCLLVHELLEENGLGQFYALSEHPGVRVRARGGQEAGHGAYLDDPAVQERLLDFTDGKTSRVTFTIPSIHCVACVWLLENLFRLNPAIGEARVNFPRREVAIRFEAQRLPLSGLVSLLVSLGYEPQLTLGELEKAPRDSLSRRRWLQVGLAGFAFGNTMLLSLPGYFGLDQFNGSWLKAVFGYLSLVLAAPVLVYSAGDYWRSALIAARQRRLTLEVPIVIGLVALYLQSAWQVLAGQGFGFLDSLTGLVFFLLCGRAFQDKSYQRLAFDRDYKCFFPLSVRRKTAAGMESIALSKLRVGDRLVVRHGELIPADARLVSGFAQIDYSFVTGESEPMLLSPGAYLYAGGQQVGGSVEIETVKAVSQSYLTSLWNHEAFQKEQGDTLNTMVNRYSRLFTVAVITIASCAALFWSCEGQWPRALKAFTSVLIVACPCALALAAPFALGTALRLLGRLNIFLKNGLVLERLARVKTLVFDKTGTLTSAHSAQTEFIGEPLLPEERRWVAEVAGHSTHPLALGISDLLVCHSRNVAAAPLPEKAKETEKRALRPRFVERAGLGLAGAVSGHEVRLGSKRWLEQSGVPMPGDGSSPAGPVCLALDGKFRGSFRITSALRPDLALTLAQLSQACEVFLVSGDNERERERFARLMPNAELRFNQAPLEKLEFIRELQLAGKHVMMVGDGLNDAGALKQSDVGVAVVENVGAFSPASDIIIDAARMSELGNLLRFSRQVTRVVHWSFAISTVYNLAGLSIAAAGLLSPLICAVLMPLSSVSVVLFASAMTGWVARRTGLGLRHIPGRAALGENTQTTSQDPRGPVVPLHPQPAI